jgi:uncharacterized membrane protein YsdA (DUF1294 family)
MENLQIKLTVLLLLIEVIAFAWLIIDIQKSKKNQNKIIELEHKILKLKVLLWNLKRLFSIRLTY